MSLKSSAHSPPFSMELGAIRYICVAKRPIMIRRRLTAPPLSVVKPGSTDFGLILRDDSRVRAKEAVVKMSRRKSFSQLFVSCLWLAFLALTVRADTCDFVTRAVGSNCTLTWNGLARQYQLYIPTAYVATTSGVVIGLHGSQGSGPTYSDPTIIDK